MYGNVVISSKFDGWSTKYQLRLPYAYSRVPNNRAARLLIFPNFSLPTRLIWTYTLIKFQKKILPTRLLCTYTVIDFSLFWLTQKICYLLTYLYHFTCAHCVLLKHYYSVDFPWWFDRKISFFSLLSKIYWMA